MIYVSFLRLRLIISSAKCASRQFMRCIVNEHPGHILGNIIIRDKFAMVGFHTSAVKDSSSLVSGFFRVNSTSFEVMTSMAPMKRSATIATPRKHHYRALL